MIPFRFPLENVLEWRRTQLELEEDKFRQETAALAELDRLRAETEAAGVKAELQVRHWRPVTGRDLGALDEFRRSVESNRKELTALRAQRLKSLAAQQSALMESRRRCRLLERLKERRFEEWRLAAARELEELASDSYLARWNRR